MYQSPMYKKYLFDTCGKYNDSVPQPPLTMAKPSCCSFLFKLCSFIPISES